MEYLEVKPVPAVCRSCAEMCCGDCDHALERWTLSCRDELILKRKGIEMAIQRLQRQLAALDRQQKELDEILSQNHSEASFLRD